MMNEQIETIAVRLERNCDDAHDAAAEFHSSSNTAEVIMAAAELVARTIQYAAIALLEAYDEARNNA